MAKTRQPKKRSEPSKPQKRRGKSPATANTRLAAQTRKMLGKHYASKYRTR